MPPSNMAPWQLEYFKVKEFEKTAEARSLTSPIPFSPEVGHKPSWERCPPYRQTKRTPLSPKRKKQQRDSEKTATFPEDKIKLSQIFFNDIVPLLDKLSLLLH